MTIVMEDTRHLVGTGAHWAECLAGCVHFASADPIGAMNGVRVEIGGNVLEMVATDRYTLAHASVAFESNSDAPECVAAFTIPAATAKQWAAECKRPANRHAPVMVTLHDDGKVTLANADSSVSFTPLTADYPAWREIMAKLPAESGKPVHALNLSYMARLAKIHKVGWSLIQDGDRAAVCRPIGGSLSAEWTVVVMPIRAPRS